MDLRDKLKYTTMVSIIATLGIGQIVDIMDSVVAMSQVSMEV